MQWGGLTALRGGRWASEVARGGVLSAHARSIRRDQGGRGGLLRVRALRSIELWKGIGGFGSSETGSRAESGGLGRWVSSRRGGRRRRRCRGCGAGSDSVLFVLPFLMIGVELEDVKNRLRILGVVFSSDGGRR